MKVAPALFDGGAPCTPVASPEARSGPRQPQAAAQRLGRRSRLPEGASRGVSSRGLATWNGQAKERGGILSARKAPASPARGGGGGGGSPPKEKKGGSLFSPRRAPAGTPRAGSPPKDAGKGGGLFGKKK